MADHAYIFVSRCLPSRILPVVVRLSVEIAFGLLPLLSGGRLPSNLKFAGWSKEYRAQMVALLWYAICMLMFSRDSSDLPQLPLSVTMSGRHK